MLTTIIIDRVGKTNVFNLIQEGNINLIPGEEQNALHGEVDDDLILEFIEELSRLASLARSGHRVMVKNNNHKDKKKALPSFPGIEVTARLREIGETFFRQFFPESLRLFFRKTETTHLFFYVDPALASIPFEILHNGENFLCERFSLGKSIKGKRLSLSPIPPREKLNMLIIADPTEDLEWARREGEILYEHLSTHYPEKKISIELLGGRSVTKLSLLSSMKGKDIIHYAGHLHHAGSSGENGWVLSQGKIVRAREIQNAEAEPWLIFSNSCLSARSQEKDKSLDWYSHFAASFIRSEKTCYVGTNWELPDTKQTLDFTLQFYTALLAGSTIGEALNQARQYALNNFSPQDLTWASYILIGNPMWRLIEREQTLPDLQAEILKPEIVLEKYPYPLARAFEEFFETSKLEAGNHLQILRSLFHLFQEFVFFHTALILANYDYLRFPKAIYPGGRSCQELLEAIFLALRNMSAVKARPLAHNLFDVLYQHKDNLYKLCDWERKFHQNEIQESEWESYAITVQYILETILHDIDFIKNYGFYLILEPGYRQLSLSGISHFHRLKEIVLPTQTNLETYEELLEKTEHLIGKLVFYNPIKKIFLDLSKYMEVQITTDKGSSPLYQILYRF
ncbi:MAG: CHAT domain-containing protein [Leptospiraceae bacterium]|nr:CHAT domain-containing protein [Leptospiraceae bacterium]MDW8307031.1 CHAT domain-containing protein [Leptospiraceae bacterium]